MNKIVKKILVTCALPYANGEIHLGHILEHIQADIWVRYQRMIGNKVYFICADDSHGTPIMLKSKKLNISPEFIIKKINLQHQKDFLGFDVIYDNYHSTHSNENYVLSRYIYKQLKKNGYVKSRLVSQFYDFEKNIFLSDRFVKGKCPVCYSIDQYGDNCESCGSIYNSIDLINPISIISGNTPIINNSEQIFFDYITLKKKLLVWINSSILQKQVVNKIKEWFKLGLRNWNISRDYPYFGFKIPGLYKKYFYVWFDAPIGYICSFKNLCFKYNNIDFNEFWDITSKVELCHFIGKDVIYFHSLLWPSILEVSGFRKPTFLFVHGYVTINGVKMSKSKGTFIKASTYLNYLDSDCLRYYYSTKLSTNIEDIDINLEDFTQRVNNDLVNKIVNLAIRNSNFIYKFFNYKLSKIIAEPSLYKFFIKMSILVGEFYSKLKISNVIKIIIILVKIANRYIDKKSPWKLVKNKKLIHYLHSICSMGIELFRILMIFLKPIVPSLSKRVEFFLNIELNWHDIKLPLYFHTIKYVKILFSRININVVNKIFSDSFKKK
ncbi:MAG: methionine--tRNA ligase [gamma proteobacterium endosymbiont of Trioza apicalis]